jgi:hypothetical protein
LLAIRLGTQDSLQLYPPVLDIDELEAWMIQKCLPVHKAETILYPTAGQTTNFVGDI